MLEKLENVFADPNSTAEDIFNTVRTLGDDLDPNGKDVSYALKSCFAFISYVLLCGELNNDKEVANDIIDSILNIPFLDGKIKRVSDEEDKNA